jgi:hypothetical protein
MFVFMQIQETQRADSSSFLRQIFFSTTTTSSYLLFSTQTSLPAIGGFFIGKHLGCRIAAMLRRGVSARQVLFCPDWRTIKGGPVIQNDKHDAYFPPVLNP